jgi:hypothetical protein
MVTEKAIKPALGSQFTVQNMSRSTVVGHLAQSVLELSRAEIATSVSQPEAHLQAVTVELLRENHDIVKR